MGSLRALQAWCRLQTADYPGVEIRDMTTSFRDGKAFCALIHRHRPELIDFDSLSEGNVYKNNQLAFQVAERELGIPALLDPEDMVAMKVPDRLSVITYVSQFYNVFNSQAQANPPTIKRLSSLGGSQLAHRRPAATLEEAEGPTLTPPTTLEEAEGPTLTPPTTLEEAEGPTLTPPTTLEEREVEGRILTLTHPNETSSGPARLQRSLSSSCSVCHQHVHLVQRFLVDRKLFHRTCFRCSECRSTLLPGSYKLGSDSGALVCTHHLNRQLSANQNGRPDLSSTPAGEGASTPQTEEAETPPPENQPNPHEEEMDPPTSLTHPSTEEETDPPASLPPPLQRKRRTPLPPCPPCLPASPT